MEATLPFSGSIVSMPPGQTERQFAIVVIATSFLTFGVIAPFAQTHLPRVLAFVPAYEAALAVNDLITSILLYGQFARVRRLSLLVVASGYLFNLCMVILHALSFPGVFSETGLLGAGVQTTAWLYIFWHGGFPLLLIAYAVIARSARWDGLIEDIAAMTAILVSAGLIVSLVVAILLLTTTGEGLLPNLVTNGNYARQVSLGISPAMLVVTLGAIVAMWGRRSKTVLDLWLFTVLWVWACDIALSAFIGSSRFDLGWYGGRLFSAAAGSLVLVSLLIEQNRLYTELAVTLAVAQIQNAELLRSRSELARAQRFEALGQLTGGIAHDFNNLLTAIIGGLDLIIKKPEARERVEKLAANALRAAERGTRLIRQLMTFARKQSLNPEILNPNAILLEFQEFAKRASGEAIELVFQLDQAVHPIRVDASELQAALLNLIGNARDAMPNGGRLLIESSNVDVDSAVAEQYGEVQPGAFARITVSDTGTGMREDIAAKVFEPFFTTKPVGQGTGLGLSQVYGFSRSANGFVTVASALGQGSTFSLFIPRSAKRPTELVSEDVLIRPALAGEAILLVEDDPDVLAALVESLGELGYAIHTATTATEALEVLQRAERVDIMFSDVVMPGGMNGVQLAVEARRLKPALKILLTSGYTGNALSQHGVPAEFPLLTKPYRREELAQKLRVVLGTSR